MKNKSEYAYAALRGKILTGALLPGVRLVEQTLSEELGVNRGDVRQALTKLCAEHLADRGEKGGYFVKVLTEKEVREIYEVRYILEISVVPLIVERATQEDYDALEAVASHMQMMAEHGYTLGVCEIDLKFHTTLMKAAHNDRLLDLYLAANIPLSGVYGMNHEISRVISGDMNDVREHQLIIEYLKKGEVGKVIALLGRGYHHRNDGASGYRVGEGEKSSFPK